MKKILLTVVSTLVLALTLTADSPSKMYMVHGDVALHIINPIGQTIDLVVQGPVRPWQDKAYLQVPADGQLSIPSISGLGIPVPGNGVVTIASCNAFYLYAFRLEGDQFVRVPVTPYNQGSGLTCDGDSGDNAGGPTVISDPPPSDGGGNGEEGDGGDDGGNGNGGGDHGEGHGGGHDHNHCDDGHGQDGEHNPHCEAL